MNENTKTAVLVLAAAVVVIGVWLTRPTASDESAESMVGQMLFPEFNPLAATSLQVTKYDEKTGDVIPFGVAQVNNIWSIPSHDNYPADAKEHLAAAAADLVDLKVLSDASNSPADHATYGVLDPSDKDLKPGTPGVGTKVVLNDKDNQTLVSMIVGKEVEKAPELRYVRRTDQDAVFTVSLDMSRLTTDFGAWIEKDLLKLNGFDIREVYIEDYTIDEAQGVVEQRDRMTLAYSDQPENPWSMALDQVYEDGKWVAVPMGPDEELDAPKLDTMKSALDDLKIVDVARKPDGLSADLAASKEFLDNKESKLSLAERGFYVAQVGNESGIYSNEGEVRCLTKEGVEYVLRFGNIAGSGKAADKAAEAKPEDGKGEAGEEDGGMNRYIFVMAEFNPSPIAKPKLDPLPEPPPTAPAEPQPATPPAEPKKDDPAKAEAKPDDSKEIDVLKVKREAIEKENKRKQDEYNAKVEAGKKKVEELNARFAKWYYVISEKTYKQIHLGRKDIVRKKQPKPAEPGQPGLGEPRAESDLPQPDDFSPAAFEKLQKGMEPE